MRLPKRDQVSLEEVRLWWNLPNLSCSLATITLLDCKKNGLVKERRNDKRRRRPKTYSINNNVKKGARVKKKAFDK